MALYTWPFRTLPGNPFYFGDNPVFCGTALQSPSDIPPVGGMLFFSICQRTCALIVRTIVRPFRAIWTPQCGGKRERVCLFKRKDKYFVSNGGGFCEVIFRFSSHCDDD